MPFPFQRFCPVHFLPALDQAIREARLKIEKIKANLEAPNFSNIIEALEMSDENLDRVSHLFYNLLHAHTNEELQKLAGEFGPKLSAHSSDVLLDDDLFTRIEAVYTHRESENLNVEATQLLKDTYDNFVRNGARLDKNKQKRLRELDQRLSQLGPIFSENVLKATNVFQLHIFNKDRKDLKGLPDSSVEAAAMAARENGKEGWIFTLHAPQSHSVFKICQQPPSS